MNCFEEKLSTCVSKIQFYSHTLSFSSQMHPQSIVFRTNGQKKWYSCAFWGRSLVWLNDCLSYLTISRNFTKYVNYQISKNCFFFKTCQQRYLPEKKVTNFTTNFLNHFFKSSLGKNFIRRWNCHFSQPVKEWNCLSYLRKKNLKSSWNSLGLVLMSTEIFFRAT